MMMMATGGPGLVSPLEFGQDRKPTPRWLVGAIGASVMIHGVAAVWLYNQRFDMPAVETPPNPRAIDTVLWKRPETPPPPVAQKAAPQTPVHKPILTTQPPVTIPLTPPEPLAQLRHERRHQPGGAGPGHQRLKMGTARRGR